MQREIDRDRNRASAEIHTFRASLSKFNPGSHIDYRRIHHLLPEPHVITTVNTTRYNPNTTKDATERAHFQDGHFLKSHAFLHTTNVTATNSNYTNSAQAMKQRNSTKTWKEQKTWKKQYEIFRNLEQQALINHYVFWYLVLGGITMILGVILICYWRWRPPPSRRHNKK